MSYKSELEERYRLARKRMGMGVRPPVVPKALMAAALPPGGVAGGTGIIPPLKAIDPAEQEARALKKQARLKAQQERSAREAKKTTCETAKDRVENDNEGMPPLEPLPGFEDVIPFSEWRRVVSAVAKRYEIEAADILGPRRARHIVQARFECMYRMRVDLKMSYLNIAEKMRRDHSTVIHAVNTILHRLLDAQKKQAHSVVAHANGMVPLAADALNPPQLAAA